MRQIKVLVILMALVLMPIFYTNIESPSNTPKAQVKEPTKPSMLISTPLGEPFPGLDGKMFARFLSGKFEFEREHLVEEGLGPVFNDTTCVSCHGMPVTGGSLDSLDDITFRIARLTKNGRYDDLERFGGEPLSNKKFVPGCEAQQIPKKAQFVSPRAAQQLFGLGLLDSLTDEAILANADPNDRDRDGISGRPNIIFSPRFQEDRIGRFGWKAHWPTMIDFCGDAYLVEIGISNPDFPQNRHPNGQRSVCDTVNSAEDFDGRVTESFVDFINLLAPPPQKPLDSSAQRGKDIFQSIGCVKCHIPTLVTANLSERPDLTSPVLANQEANLYSDLLLHDMGEELRDNIQTGIASPTEWRTQPLWGLSSKKFFLHDARTTDLSRAITAHGGEAENSKQNFLKLKRAAQQDLINFLKSL